MSAHVRPIAGTGIGVPHRVPVSATAENPANLLDVPRKVETKCRGNRQSGGRYRNRRGCHPRVCRSFFSKETVGRLTLAAANPSTGLPVSRQARFTCSNGTLPILRPPPERLGTRGCDHRTGGWISAQDQAIATQRADTIESSHDRLATWTPTHFRARATTAAFREAPYSIDVVGGVGRVDRSSRNERHDRKLARDFGPSAVFALVNRIGCDTMAAVATLRLRWVRGRSTEPGARMTGRSVQRSRPTRAPETSFKPASEHSAPGA